MTDPSLELLDAVREIRELLRLMAEPAIDARDRKLRNELRRIVGESEPRANSVLLMDGTRLQATIRAQSRMHQGNLSTLVKKLAAAKLLCGDTRLPKLAILIPSNFFETDAETE
jgi:hypothetical protein